MPLNSLTLATFVLLGTIPLQAQTSGSAMLPSEMPVRQLQTEDNGVNTFVIGLRSSTDFDDNVLSSDRNTQPNVLTVLEPHVGWNISDSRIKWMFDYRPGISTSYPLSIYTPLSHSLDSGFQFKLTKRLTLHVHETLLESNNPFDQLQTYELTPGSSVLDRPSNPILAGAHVSNEQAQTGLTYALSSRTLFELSTTFYSVAYDSAATNQELSRTEALSTHLLYLHQLSRHTSAGLDFNIHNLTSWEPRSRSHVHSFLYTGTMLLRPNMAATLFIGPEHSTTLGNSSLFVNASNLDARTSSGWSWAGGANYIWTGATTKLIVSWSRRISDGAALQGVVRFSSLDAQLWRQITRRWKADLVASDNHNQPLVSNIAPLSYVSVACGLTRAITPRLSLELRYWRIEDITSGASLSPYVARHNRVSTSLVYDFIGPLKK